MLDHTAAPLVRWDGLHVVLDVDRLERRLRDRLRRDERVLDVRLGGHSDVIAVRARIRHRGVTAWVEVEVSETRLRRRHLGCRIRRVRVLGGLRIPRRVVMSIARRAGGDLVTVFEDQGIVVVDLSRWVPRESEITLLTAQVTGRSLHLWIGPGRLQEMPGGRRRGLAAGAAAAAPGKLPASS
jgi:hypothetical protein